MKTLKFILVTLSLAILTVACSNSESNPTPQSSCQSLTTSTNAARDAYNNANSSNLSALCNAYKTALQNEINGCGDATGDLQDMIDGLNCNASTPTGTLSMSLGSAPLVFDEITVTTTGATRHVHGEKSSTTSYEIDFDVEVGQTGINKINNFELRLFSQTFRPLIPAAFGNDWTSNITVNSGTSVVGTFRGELANESQTSAQDLLNGVVNINF